MVKELWRFSRIVKGEKLLLSMLSIQIKLLRQYLTLEMPRNCTIVKWTVLGCIIFVLVSYLKKLTASYVRIIRSPYLHTLGPRACSMLSSSSSVFRGLMPPWLPWLLDRFLCVCEREYNDLCIVIGKIS